MNAADSHRLPTLRIGLIGDYDPEITAHQAILASLQRAIPVVANAEPELTWIPTEKLDLGDLDHLRTFDGLWCVPASPYASMKGALRGIQFAREQQIPFLGTCGGFQHLLIEYARNVVGLPEADHEETAPASTCLLISKLTDSFVERQREITIREGTMLYAAYQKRHSCETYHCNFGPNPAFAEFLRRTPLRMAAQDATGSVHAVELPGHPFYVGTLYQPERAGLRNEIHPVVRAFVESANALKAGQ